MALLNLQHALSGSKTVLHVYLRNLVIYVVQIFKRVILLEVFQQFLHNCNVGTQVFP